MLNQADENTILFVKKKKLKKLQIRVEPYKNDECRTFFVKKTVKRLSTQVSNL